MKCDLKNRSLQLNSLADTEQFGVFLGTVACPGDIICLGGDLGAGKTTLTQSIAAGLQVPKSSYVTSPSFAIVHEYSGRLPLYHMDFYRLESSGEIEDMGLVEYFYQSGLTVIEWSERAGELIPSTRLYLRLRVGDEQQRIVECDWGTGNWRKRLTEMFYANTNR